MAQFAIDELFTTGVQISGFIFDYSSRLGTPGQVLTSTSSGVMWQADSSNTDLAALSGQIIATGALLNNRINSLSGYANGTFLSGSGTQYYVPRWNTSKELVTGSIYDNGFVGIGITNPSGQLHLRNMGFTSQSGIPDSNIFPNATGVFGLVFDHNTYTNGQYRHRLIKVDRNGNLPLYLQQAGATANQYINLARFGTHTYSTNTFEVFGDSRINGTASITSNLLVTGNVGIGTANPAVKLHIENSGTISSIATVRLVGSTGNNAGSQIEFYKAQTPEAAIGLASAVTGGLSDDLLLLSTNPNSIVLTAGLSGLATFKPDGKVGIGIYNPISLLSIGGAASTSAASGLSFGQDAQANLYRSAEDTIKTDGSLVVTSNGTFAGNVGIGTTGPLTALDVRGRARVQNNTAGTAFYVQQDDGSNDVVEFYRNTTSNFILKSNGNVGIGITNPAFKLDVSGGNARFSDYIIVGEDLAYPSNTGSAYLGYTANPASAPQSNLELIDALSNAIGVNDPLRFRTTISGQYFSGNNWYADPAPLAYSNLLNGNATSYLDLVTSSEYSVGISGKRFVVDQGTTYTRPNFILLNTDWNQNFWGFKLNVENSNDLVNWTNCITEHTFTTNNTKGTIALSVASSIQSGGISRYFRFSFVANQAITAGSLRVNKIRSLGNQNYSSSIPVSTSSTGHLIASVGIISPTITSLSGNIAATGSTLDTKINTTNTNLAATGSTLNTKINTLSGYSNATFATITNLATTGSTLDTKINTLSGYSNANFATVLNLAATGSTLDTKINTLSGYSNANFATILNLAATGSTLDTKINTTNTNLAATGSTLDTKINTLSGYSNANFATVLNLAATGSTLDTKINTLSGYSNATFATITNLAATGSVLDTKINTLSGYSNANFATILNLAATGSTLDTKINTLSGYAGNTFLSGVGVSNYVPRWSGTKLLVTGNLYDNGINVGIGTNNPNTKLRVAGSFSQRASGSTAIQEYKNIVTYSLDNYGSGGYVVKTPFQIGTSYEMAIVHVKGYGYGDSKLYDFKVVFYDYGPSSAPISYSLVDLGNDGSPKYLAKDATNYLQVCFGNTTDVNNYYYRFTVDCITTRNNNDYSQGWGMYQTTGTNFGFASTGIYTLASPINFNAATNYVGIGKTNPTCQLDVVGTIRSSTNQIYGFGANDSVSLRANSSVNVLGIYTSNVERLRLAANGYFGVGTDNPSTLLSIGGAGSTSAASGITFGADSQANLYRISSSRIKTDGNFTIDGQGGGSTSLVLNRSSTSSENGMAFNTAGVTDWYFYVNDATSNLQIQRLGENDATPRVRFDGSNSNVLFNLGGGNIGVGTDSPNYKLDVIGSVRASGELISEGNNTRLSLFRNNGINYFDWASGQSLYFSTQTSVGGGGRSTLMSITSGGNVGIGTVTPNGRLHVVSPDSTYAFSVAGATKGVRFNLNSAGTYIQGVDNTLAGSYQSLILGGSDLYFQTNGLTNAMYIDSSGDVGINTTSPTSKLHVVETTATGTRIQLGTASTNALMNSGSTNDLLILNAPYGNNPASTSNIGAKWGIKFVGAVDGNLNSNNKTSAIYAVSEDTLGYNRGTSLAFYTNQWNDQPYAERMRIYHNGNIGIGITNPVSRLDVNGTISISGYPLADRFAVYNRLWNPELPSIYLGDSSDPSNYYDNTTHIFRARGAGAERMRITSAGNVGIGTVVASRRIHAYTETGPVMRLESSGSNASIEFAPSLAGNGLYNWLVGAQQNVSNAFEITPSTAINGTTFSNPALLITSAGNVGIGTTNPTVKLHITNSGTVSSIATVRLVGSTGNNAGSQIEFYKAQTPEASIGLASAVTGGLSDDLILLSANPNSIVLSAGASGISVFKADGKVGIGTINPQTLLSLGGLGSTSAASGLTFGGDAQANLYRSAEDTIRTDGSLVVNGNFNTNTTTVTTLNINAGTLPGIPAGSTITGFTYAVNNGNVSQINLVETRFQTGSDWTTASTRIQKRTDVTNQAYIEFNPSGASYGMALGVGANSNVEALRILSNGSIGIGTTNPAGKLQVVQGDANARYSTFSSVLGLLVKGNDNSAYNLLTLENTQTGTNYGASINFNLGYGGNSAAAGTAILGARIVAAAEQNFTSTASTQDGYLALYTTLDGASSEKVRVRSDGNVGIGTTSPSQKLEVSGNIKLTDGGYIYGDTAAPYLRLNQANGTYLAYSTTSVLALLGSVTTLSAGSNYLGLITNGSERFRISSNGNVGIGTTNPVSALHIYSGNGTSQIFNQLQLTNMGTPNQGDIVGMGFAAGESTQYGVKASIGFVRTGNFGIGDLAFYANRTTGISSVSTTDERLRIQSNGNVGIGLASSLARLHIMEPNGANDNVFQRWSYTNSVGVYDLLLKQTVTSSVVRYNFSMINNSTSYLNVLVLDRGNVGIGTTNPDYQLTVIGANQATANVTDAGNKGGSILVGSSVNATNQGGSVLFATLNDAGNYTPQYAIKSLFLNGNGYGLGDLAFSSRRATGDTSLTESVRFTYDGKVGIGTAIPSSPLHVFNTSTTLATFTRDLATDAGFAIGADNNGTVLSTIGVHAIQIYTNNTEKARITSDGKLGIGTNTPTTLLSVGGAGSTTAASGITFGGEAGTNIYRLSTNELKTDGSFVVSNTLLVGGGGIGLRILKDGSDSISSTLYLANAANTRAYNFQQNAAGTNLALWTYNSANTWQNSVNFNYNGSVGIGTTTPSGKLHVVSTIASETVLRADGTNGTLFSVVDDLSDSLMSVNNSAGLPVFEVFADDRIVAGQYGSGDFVLVNNKVGIGTSNPSYKLDVNGSLGINASTSDTNWPFVVSDNSSAGSRYGLNKFGSMGFNYADAYAQLQLLGANGAYIDFTNSVGGDSNARLIYYAGARLDLTYGFAPKSTISVTPNAIGIGTTNPFWALDVSGTAIRSFASGAVEPGFIVDYASSNGYGGLFIHTNGVRKWRIGNVGDTDASNPALFIWQEGVGARMYFRNNGYVGVGTTVPNTKLSVSVPSDSALGSTSDGLSITDGTRNVQLLRNGTGYNYAGVVGSGSMLYSYDRMYIVADTSNPILFHAGGAERARVQANGNIGIGLTIPQKPLDVISSSNDFVTVGARVLGIGNWCGIHFGYREDNNLYRKSAIVFERTDLTSSNAQGKVHILNGPQAGSSNATLSDAKITINEAGKVGIGTTEPLNKLSVIASNGTAYYNRTDPVATFQGTSPSTILVSVDGNVDGYYAELKLGNAQSTYYPYSAYVRGIQGAGIDYYRLEFGTSAGSAANTRMTIANNGNVGIGLTNTQHKLQISGGSVAFTTSTGLAVEMLGMTSLNVAYVGPYNTSTDGNAPSTVLFNHGASVIQTWFYSSGRVSMVLNREGRLHIGNLNNTPNCLLSVGPSSSTTAVSGMCFGNDAEANFYRSAEDTIKSDGNLIIVGNVTAANLISGNGTTNYITKWNGTKSVTNSQIFDDGTYVGVNTAVNTTYRLQVNGSFAATTKSFDIVHPTVSGKRLIYASLEGPENGVYYRGQNNNNEINLPHYWSGLVHEDSLTVNLTAVGKRKDGKIRNYSVDQIGHNKVYIYTDSDDNIYNYYYTIFAERKDVSKLVTERYTE